MLSKELYDQFDTHLLYKIEPKFKISSNYNCKNWTFRAYKFEDGTVWMLDTYFNSWDSHKIQVTNDNYMNFEVVFDFREMERVRDSETDEYDEEDLIRVATDSGGYSCGRLYWKKKGILRSKRKLIDKYEEKVRSVKWQLECAEEDLKKILEGTYYLCEYCKTE